MPKNTDTTNATLQVAALIRAALVGDISEVRTILAEGVDVNSQVTMEDSLCLVHYKSASMLKLRSEPIITFALTGAAYRGNLEVASLLLDHGADVNAQLLEDTFETAFIAGIWSGRTDMVQLLLNRGANVNMVCHTAAAANSARENLDRRTELLKYQKSMLNIYSSSDINLDFIQGGLAKTALIAAIEKGEEDIVLLLLDQGAEVNIVDGIFTPALTVAIQQGNKNIVQLILDRGADVNIVGGLLGTALVAAMEKGKEEIVQLLLERGADVNTVGGMFGTALIAYAAIQEGILKKDTMQVLLDRGGDVNIVGGIAGTALIAAIQEHKADTVQFLLEQGADVNIVGGIAGTALIAAIQEHRKDFVHLLLEKGADVNIVGGISGTALIAAIENNNLEVVQLLLERGADVNMVGGVLGTALIAATQERREDIVRLLLGRGTNVNPVGGVFGTALIAASEEGNNNILQLLLDSGADMSIGAGVFGTALLAAMYMAREDMVDFLQDRGAGVNVLPQVNGRYVTQLILTIYLDVSSFKRLVPTNPTHTNHETKHFEVIGLLLRLGSDVSIVVEGYGTALIATISRFDFKMENQEEIGLEWSFLRKLLNSVDRIPGCINTVTVEHGTALIAAISNNKPQLVGLLIEHEADVKRTGGAYKNALGAAVAAWVDPEDVNFYHVLSWLLESGAEINDVSGDLGSVLGKAVYIGAAVEFVKFLLEHGADPFHVGGRYQTALGGYSNALDAAQSPGSKAGPDLIALLEDAIAGDGWGWKNNIAASRNSPPFPMPYYSTGTKLTTTQSDVDDLIGVDVKAIYTLPMNTALRAHQADHPCAALDEEMFVQTLAQLIMGVCTGAPEFARCEAWIRNDVRYFVNQRYDFGLAYAAARVGWRHFKEPGFNISWHRAQWLRSARTLDDQRNNLIYHDNTGQEMIRTPYEVMPRRIWDLKSNRVVEFRMLHSETLATYTIATEMQLQSSKQRKDAVPRGSLLSQDQLPSYWAISHSWTSSMESVELSINQYQWQVLLPQGLEIERDLRPELLNYGIVYIWLDVLCLRQRNSPGRHVALMSQDIKTEESL